MLCEWTKYLYKYVENILQRQTDIENYLIQMRHRTGEILYFPTSGKSLIFPGASRRRAL